MRMEGLQNFLQFIYDNWTSIMVCIGLIVGMVMKVTNFLKKSDEEKIAIAKEQITQTILKLITSAEVDFQEWNDAGKIKRAQVIEEIFEKYPILSKAANQQEVIDWIDEQIDEALKTLREIVEENKPESKDNENKDNAEPEATN